MQHKIFPALLAASIVALTAAPATALEHGDPATDSPEARTVCLLYTSPSPRDRQKSRMPSSA